MDLLHNCGADLNVSAGGDLAIATGTVYGQQRVLRRLLTNPGDYIWHLLYGAGLARFVGQPAPAASIQAVTQSQMLLERAVSQSPGPKVSIVATDAGVITEKVQYIDSSTGEPATLTVPVS